MNEQLEFQYYEKNDGTVGIFGYEGNGEILDIPSQINGRAVVEIAEFAFNSNASVRQIVIPEGVVSIGDDAFADCRALSDVTFPHSLRTIDAGAFRNCSNLSTVIFREGLKTVQENAFENCTALEQVELPDSVQYIGKEAFCGCVRLQHFTLPNCVLFIGQKTFDGCENLILSVVPGSFREGYARWCGCPVVLRECNAPDAGQPSSAVQLRDVLYEIISRYADYRTVAGERPGLPVSITEECLSRRGNPGMQKKFWSFTFPDGSVQGNLKDALLRAIFHPDVNVHLVYGDIAYVCAEDRSWMQRHFPQRMLPEDAVILRLEPVPALGAITYWFVVSDHQILIVEQYWYD